MPPGVCATGTTAALAYHGAMTTLAIVLALSSYAQVPFEAALLDVPDADQLRRYHELLGSEPHVAGTPGDERVIQRIVDAFEGMGLEVERHDFYAYLPQPVSGSVRITSPVELSLAVQEDALLEDPDTAHRALGIGWNAYSGNGLVTAEVVYANHGTREDFARLAEMGVETRGRIVIEGIVVVL